MAPTTKQLYRFPDNTRLIQAVTEAILAAAQQAIAKNGLFKMVLAGGNSFNPVYRRLSETDADWAKWWIFWGDERCLPVDNAERNSLMAKQAWLDKVSISTTRIFPIPAEQGAKQGAENYEAIIAQHLPFDLVLLGMGEDGHTASLFPGHVHDENELVHEVYHSPKPPSDRVSLSAKALSNAERVLFLIIGAGKQDILKSWQQDENLPVAQIKPKNGIAIYADYSALGMN
jgi:6-phosphogluconolactonase